MQTILGAGGAIGGALAKDLKAFTNDIRLVSRNPKKVNESDQLFPADLTKRDDVFRAVADSEIVYLTPGFEYKIKVWREVWPTLMRNVIDACIQNNSKLVFFDNIYMYDQSALGHLTEDSPIKPPSKKGEIRKEIAQLLLDATKDGKLQALIARSADFYGPNINNSFLLELIYKNLAKGKKAQWFADAHKVHTFTYTPDAAKATALLGNTPDAYNQVWHLPTTKERLTGQGWATLIAKEMGKSDKLTVVPKWMVGLLGLFMPFMKEVHEMLYQYDRDYVFDSSKFDQRFNFKPTDPITGVKEMVAGGS